MIFNIRIGTNVKIINSVILDNVNIKDKCHIQNSVIGHNCIIYEKSQLKDCFVSEIIFYPYITIFNRLAQNLRLLRIQI